MITLKLDAVEDLWKLDALLSAVRRLGAGGQGWRDLYGEAGAPGLVDAVVLGMSPDVAARLADSFERQAQERAKGAE
ncbi:hypothetical protein [Anaeromyxobacter dehalogenans]|uniref:Uncharacterized protein n=1 Tax=Anaeromyxobacter dehalogenans (strain 2CP-C) TaxID=290397 RepID=Q2IJ19_ANADE|nr:hypothetical protein [Anaeromyxobacter dehalogenans]ABC81649.1 hypothetical protein Adeh_1878 [Anaeromyxobacter dehalogenans 2CP-C]